LNTPTPRTDAESFYPDDSKEKAVDSFFAQQLERELAALTAERDQLRALLVYIDQLHDEALDDIISEREQLRAELAVAQNWVQHKSHHADDLIAENVELRAERDQLRAELATERARLDYVLKNDCAWNDRSEIDQDIKNMSAESKK